MSEPNMTLRRARLAAAFVLALVIAVVLAVAVTMAATGSGNPTSSANAAQVIATCHNNSSDAATIQREINNSVAGDAVVFAGPCLINKTIKLLAFRTYEGQSRTGTVLKQAKGANLPAILASDSWANNTASTGGPIVVRDLTIDGNKHANHTMGAALVIRSWHTTVEDIDVLDSSGVGIEITNLSQNHTALTDTQVNGTIRNVFVSGARSDGIRVQDTGNSVTDWNLLDSWIGYCGGTGIDMGDAAGWVVERNHLYGNGAAGISAGRLYGSSISDNYIEDFNTSGILATVQGGAGSVIMGNRIFNFHGHGTTFLNIAKVNYGTGMLAVTGNIIRGTGKGIGLSYRRGAHLLIVTSTGNLVQGVKIPRVAGRGVFVTAGH